MPLPAPVYSPRMVPLSPPRNARGGSASGGSPSPNSPRRLLSSTKSRIALDKLPPRSASICDRSALTDSRRRAAISHKASQNADSNDTLVACPAIRTECLVSEGLFIAPERRQAWEAFQALGRRRRGNPTRGL